MEWKKPNQAEPSRVILTRPNRVIRLAARFPQFIHPLSQYYPSLSVAIEDHVTSIIAVAGRKHDCVAVATLFAYLRTIAQRRISPDGPSLLFTGQSGLSYSTLYVPCALAR